MAYLVVNIFVFLTAFFFMDTTLAQVTCPTITINNGDVNTTATDVDEVASFTCDQGYKFEGENPVYCQGDGTWSGSYSCEAIDCGTFTPANAEVDFSDGTLMESIAVITCLTGYEFDSAFPDNPVQSECQEDKTWTSEEGCVIKDCGSIPAVNSNGFVEFETSTAVTTYGSELLYKCNTGYTPENTTITCDATGSWSSQHVCTVVDCGELSTNVANGQVTVQGTTYGQTATYSCNNNFGVEGAEVLTCQESGQWSADPPTCSRLQRVRVVSYMLTSLDCDDFDQAGLGRLLQSARASMPRFIILFLGVIPGVVPTVVIAGISCNSPLAFVVEVEGEGAGNVTEATEMIKSSLTALTNEEIQLEVDGQNTSLSFTEVSTSETEAETCEKGYFNERATLSCQPCAKDTYQPNDVDGLCLPCPDDKITKTTGTFGDVDDVCVKDSAGLYLGLSIGIPMIVLVTIAVSLGVLYFVSKANRPSEMKYRYDYSSSGSQSSGQLPYRSRQMYFRQQSYRW